MGSLVSKPKAPRAPQPQMVYVSQPAATVPAVITPAPATPAPVTPDPEQEAAAARKTSLLTRDRGRFGTIATTFRGFLGERDTTQKRKTLLGE